MFHVKHVVSYLAYHELLLAIPAKLFILIIWHKHLITHILEVTLTESIENEVVETTRLVFSAPRHGIPDDTDKHQFLLKLTYRPEGRVMMLPIEDYQFSAIIEPDTLTIDLNYLHSSIEMMEDGSMVNRGTNEAIELAIFDNNGDLVATHPPKYVN